jgi:hypothetical protein
MAIQNGMAFAEVVCAWDGFANIVARHSPIRHTG